MTTFKQSLADWAKRWTTRTDAEYHAIRRYPRGVSFRIFHPADEAACLELYRALEAGFPADGTDNFLATLRRAENSIVIAEREGIVVGMGGIGLSGENTATLWYGLVAPAHQGTGIGTALALLRLCSLPTDDFGVLIYTLEKPQSFYRRLGFQPCFHWDDGHGHRHPGALLDLAGFRRDFVLDLLRTRGVTLDGTLVPKLEGSTFIDRIRLDNGRYHFRTRGEGVPQEGDQTPAS